jgi:hypothetical protein
MRWLLPLLAASLVLFGLSLSSAGARRGGGGVPRPLVESAKSPLQDGLSRTRGTEPLRVGCERPGTLRLRRFEDRSARLECAGQVLVRVSVPG